MKKILGLCAAVAAATTMFVSCSNGTSVKIKTSVDTLNYAFGAANGEGVRQYILGDSATDAQAKMFADGFNAAIDKSDRLKSLKLEGFRMGSYVKEVVNEDFLFGDSTALVNKELFMTSLTDAIKGKFFMQPLDAKKRFDTLAATPLSTGESGNFTPEQSDSLNMLLALVNGQMVRATILGTDTAEKFTKSFISGLNEGVNSTDDNKFYLDGIQMAGNMDYQLKSMQMGLFNDTTLPLNRNIVVKGMTDAIEQNPDAIMTGKDAQEYVTVFFERRNAERAKVEAKAGEDFLAENAKKEGVFVTESGLQYKVITMGNGEKPTAENHVKVHYHGTLIDGTVFDSSVERGEPAEFPLNAVIKGWTEGLQLMPVGSKFTFYIPYQLAYGERGAGADIKPYSALIFDVELLEIVK